MAMVMVRILFTHIGGSPTRDIRDGTDIWKVWEFALCWVLSGEALGTVGA